MSLVIKTVGLLFILNFLVTAALWIVADIDERWRRSRGRTAKRTIDG